MNSGLRLSARWLLAAGLRRSSREQTTQWTVDSSLYVRSSVIYICVLWRLTLKPPQYTKKRTCVVDVHVDVHARRARVPYPGSRLPVSIGRRRISRAHTFTAHSSRCTGSEPLWTSSPASSVVDARVSTLWSVCSVWTLIVSDSRTDTRRCKQTRGGGWGGGYRHWLGTHSADSNRPRASLLRTAGLRAGEVHTRCDTRGTQPPGRDHRWLRNAGLRAGVEARELHTRDAAPNKPPGRDHSERLSDSSMIITASIS